MSLLSQQRITQVDIDKKTNYLDMSWLLRVLDTVSTVPQGNKGEHDSCVQNITP